MGSLSITRVSLFRPKGILSILTNAMPAKTGIHLLSYKLKDFLKNYFYVKNWRWIPAFAGITPALLFLTLTSHASAQANCEEIIIRVHGNSLAPLAKDGAEIDGVRGDCGAPKHGDFVLVDSPRNPNLPLIKIVFGVPGDKFRLKETEGGHNLIINGTLAKNSEGKPYLFAGKRKDMLSLYEGPIPANTYLILGNDPSGSTDSTRIGLVDKSAIAGVAKRK